MSGDERGATTELVLFNTYIWVGEESSRLKRFSLSQYFRQERNCFMNSLMEPWRHEVAVDARDCLLVSLEGEEVVGGGRKEEGGMR